MQPIRGPQQGAKPQLEAEPAGLSQPPSQPTSAGERKAIVICHWDLVVGAAT